MAEGKATTVRFSDEIYRQLEQASRVSGLPINSIVVVACLEWLQARCGLPGLPIGPTAWLPRTLTRLQPGLQLGVLAGGRGWQALAGPAPPYSFELLSPLARQAMAMAQQEAEKAGHGHIGTEHLLLALAATPGAARDALQALGVTEPELTAALQEHLKPAGEARARSVLPTSRVRTVVRHAFEEAQRAGAGEVGPEHLLLGILIEGEGVAAQVLGELGVSEEKAREALTKLSG